MPYRNPIISGFNPDPSICRVGDDYFLATSTFEYFPGVPIYNSTNLIDWKLIGHALNRRSQLDMRVTPPGAGIYAPTLRHHDGRFYMATACANRGDANSVKDGPEKQAMVECFFVYTDDIWSNRWSDPVPLGPGCDGIDQDLFFDDDGRVYHSWVSLVTDPALVCPGVGKFNMGTHCSEIDITTGRLLGPTRLLRASHFGITIAEGPHIFKRGKYYYLITAEGGTELEHQEWITRSESPLGPYELPPSGVNPLIYNAKDRDIQQTGHMDIVEAPDGKTWVVFLAVRPRYEANGEMVLSQLGRETFLAPAEWTEDGWLRVNGGRAIGVTGEAEGVKMREETFAWRDDFESATLDLSWTHLRTPLTPSYTLSPGSLTLHGNQHRITDVECPALLLQRQPDFRVVWTTELNFHPSRDGDEAGTTVYWSRFAYGSLGVRKAGEGREAVFTWADHESDDIKSLTSPITSPGPINLTIHADDLSYDFSFTESGAASPTASFSMPSKVLVRTRPGIDSIFTGTFMGIYAQGSSGEACPDPASFKYVEYQGRR